VPTANVLSGGLDEWFQRTDASGTRAFLNDALGSTVALTDPSGVLTGQNTYEPFGRTTPSGSLSVASAFTGRELDEGGLYFYRARYLDPGRQRFISEDPLGISGGDVNLYTYASNSPIRSTDPFGLAPTNKPPRGIPGGPWEWSPNDANSRGGVYVDPNHKVASWDPEFQHWDFNDPKVPGRRRFNRHGAELEDGHLRPKGPPQRTPIGRLAGDFAAAFGEMSFLLGEYVEQQDLARRASHNRRSPAWQACYDSTQAGDPEYYLTPIGVLRNPNHGLLCF
jgi:RHS repeat-associated protein